jgi:MFS family permease
MIAAGTRRDALGTAFGVHRSMDTIGAMIGPLVAFAILAAIPGGYDAVLVVSGCVALIGVAVLVLFVPDLRPTREATEPPPSLRGVGALGTGATLRPVLATAGLLALLTVSDGFLYLSLQRREELATELFPLLFVGTSVVYLLLAAPVGRLADRAGRRRVYLAGHLVLVGAYVAALGAVPGPLGVLACLALLGTYYAATDGVLAALTSARLPESLRATGLALVQTVVAAARFSSALLFGAVWTGLGREVALLVFAGALLAVLPAAAALLRSAGSGPAGRVAGP